MKVKLWRIILENGDIVQVGTHDKMPKPLVESLENLKVGDSIRGRGVYDNHYMVGNLEKIIKISEPWFEELDIK